MEGGIVGKLPQNGLHPIILDSYRKSTYFLRKQLDYDILKVKKSIEMSQSNQQENKSVFSKQKLLHQKREKPSDPGK